MSSCGRFIYRVWGEIGLGLLNSVFMKSLGRLVSLARWRPRRESDEVCANLIRAEFGEQEHRGSRWRGSSGTRGSLAGRTTAVCATLSYLTERVSSKPVCTFGACYLVTHTIHQSGERWRMVERQLDVIVLP